MSHILTTPFGTFRGYAAKDTTQYRGIKYARLADQLCVPELVTTYRNGVIDATRFGPRAPAIDGCNFEQATLIQCTIGVPESAPPMSGTECLNLNITVPASATNGLMPVMVFIHGGGFLMGANYWAQYDPCRLVELASDEGMPVVVVGVNYRLGVLGNLTSREMRDAGYHANNSLRDQKCALQWIKRHVAAFGGDSKMVTVFGESAGAASVLYQLQSKEPLFKRCISMSGTPIMLKPLLLEVAEVSYALIMKELGLENASPETRIQKLRTIEPEELVEKIPMGIPLLPVLDGDIVLQPITFAKLAMSAAAVPDPTWCEDLIIGDCQHDGNVFFFMGLAQQKSDIASALTTSLHVNLPAAAANAVLDAYNLCYATGDNEAMKRIIDLGTDIAYAGPALAYARSFPGKAYYYQFNEPNPWDGQFEGCSTHMLDAAFLFQNYSKHLSNDAHRVGRALALDFVKFANGVKPWDEYDKEVGQVRMYGPSITSVVDIVKNNGWTKGRRNTLWELSDKGTIDLDQLSIAWDMFVARKPYNTTG